jgi:hypothetical protein
MASNYHQLGNVACLRGRLSEAGDWYRKSLPLYESLGDRPHMAAGYHQLGNVARKRGLLGEAENWYGKSLAINEELGDRPGMALTYGQLGLLAPNSAETSARLWNGPSGASPCSTSSPTHLRVQHHGTSRG